ncbi:MAG: hypothetical protein R6W93_07465 [Candidatus Limnocylindrales bacterium]|jgi:hypothetical protein
MTDQAEPKLERHLDMESGVYRPAVEGRERTVSRPGGDYRDGLRSRRWNAAPLRNPEVEKTDPRIAVLVIVLMSAVTLGVLVLGYGVLGLWSLPA